MGWVTPGSGHFTPGKQTQYPLYRRLGGPTAGLEGAEEQKLRAWPRLQSRIIQGAAVRHSGLQVRASTMLLLLTVGSYEGRNWDCAPST